MIKHSNSYNLLERASAIFLADACMAYNWARRLSLAPSKHRWRHGISWSDEDGNGSVPAVNVEKAPPGSTCRKVSLRWNSAKQRIYYHFIAHKLYNTEEYVAFTENCMPTSKAGNFPVIF